MNRRGLLVMAAMLTASGPIPQQMLATPIATWVNPFIYRLAHKLDEVRGIVPSRSTVEQAHKKTPDTHNDGRADSNKAITSESKSDHAQ